MPGAFFVLRVRRGFVHLLPFSYIYVSVKDLAELTSEGETSDGSLSDGTWGGTVLKVGSTGTAVEQAQFWLATLAQYDSDIPTVTVDGVFGTATRNAVLAFQRKYGLTADGIIGKATWEALYAEYESIESDIGTPNEYPGTPLRQGDRGEDVRLVQFWLKIARSVYKSLPDLSVDGIFGAGTRAAVVAFQNYFGLTADGVVGRNTWNKLYEVYNDIANQLLSPSLRPGEYPGVLRRGSTGTAVRELQYYLYIMAAYEPSIPTVSIDGTFGPATEAAVRAFQQFAGLTVDGVVGRNTWTALYEQASRLRLSGPVVTIRRMDWPGTALTLCDTGEAVLYYSILLARIGYYFPQVPAPAPTSVYNQELADATRAFQALLGLDETGTADQATWLAAEALSLTLLAYAEPTGTAADQAEYPGSAMAGGSAGAAVRQVQQWSNAVTTQDPSLCYLDEDGVYGTATRRWITAFQTAQGLSPNGVVDRATWLLLREAARRGCGCTTQETEA